MEKIRAAVREHLTKTIAYWDRRAEELRLQEQAGKPNARLNSQEARRRADDFTDRLKKRMQELDQEAQISPLLPVVMGGFVVIPAGLLAKMQGHLPLPVTPPADTQALAAAPEPSSWRLNAAWDSSLWTGSLTTSATISKAATLSPDTCASSRSGPRSRR